MEYKERLYFNYYIPTKIIFGVDAIKEVRKEMDRMGMRKPLVITDDKIKESAMVKSLEEVLGGQKAGVFGEVIPDSSIKVVNKGVEYYWDSGADSLISIGGGSTMDTAKAIGTLATKKKKDLCEFLGIGKVGEAIVPHIAIPTTSGTGSEVSMYASFHDSGAKVKRLMGDPYLIPQVAILDPMLTITLPPDITAATGMDAMSHAVESLHARGYEPIADGLANQAIRLIIRYLPRCVEKGDDVEARGMQAIASTIGGMAFQNAMVGCVHGMATALGGMYGLHHGLANAILLPHGMRFNMLLSAHRYRQLGEAFGLDLKGKSDAEVGEMAAQAMEKFTKQLGLPQRLSEANIPKDNLEEVAKLAVADPAMRSNIRRVKDPMDILPVLLGAW